MDRINSAQATQIAQTYVKNLGGEGAEELALIDAATSEQPDGWVFFYAPRAQVVLSNSNPTAEPKAAFLVERLSGYGSYAFFVCSDNGYWDVSRFDATIGNSTTIADGYVGERQSYDMKATATGTNLTLSLDGAIVSRNFDSTYSTTDSVSLGAGAFNETGPVYFSNFTFSPLP